MFQKLEKKKKKTNNFLSKRETILPKHAVLFSLTNPRHLSLKFLHSTSLKYWNALITRKCALPRVSPNLQTPKPWCVSIEIVAPIFSNLPSFPPFFRSTKKEKGKEKRRRFNSIQLIEFEKCTRYPPLEVKGPIYSVVIGVTLQHAKLMPPFGEGEKLGETLMELLLLHVDWGERRNRLRRWFTRIVNSTTPLLSVSEPSKLVAGPAYNSHALICQTSRARQPRSINN